MNTRSEIHRRAKQFARESVLKVDYYRIRRRFAWQLPITRFSNPPSEAFGDIPIYPWTIWLLWSLEERIFSLGWSAEWGGGEDVLAAARRDLEALAEFPFYFETGRMTLGASHAGRILGTALAEWRWLDEPLRGKLRGALERYLDEAGPAIDWAFQEKAKGTIPGPILHNIPVIGVLTCAMAASIVKHPLSASLRELSIWLLGEIGKLQKTGCEGICYDGYVYDFALSWLRVLPVGEARELASYLDLNALFHRSLAFGLPGNPADLAQIADVEPVEMPFHLSAQAKLEQLVPTPGRAAWLHAVPASWMRAETLAHLPDASNDGWTDRGILDGGYAISLRNGSHGLFPVVSVHQSPFNHMHKDLGHLCIGSRNEWLIIDPGYQQYRKTSEREFSLGPGAHNCPVINGIAQTCVPSARRFQTLSGEGYQGVVIDLSEGYGGEAGMESVRRYVWQTDGGSVVVADVVSSKNPVRLEYCWHGARHGFWEGTGDGFAVHGDEASLFIRAAGLELGGGVASRLRGSRGELSLKAAVETDRPVWWVFSPTRPIVSAAALTVEDAGSVLLLEEGVCLSVRG